MPQIAQRVMIIIKCYLLFVINQYCCWCNMLPEMIDLILLNYLRITNIKQCELEKRINVYLRTKSNCIDRHIYFIDKIQWFRSIELVENLIWFPIGLPNSLSFYSFRYRVSEILFTWNLFIKNQKTYFIFI